MMWSLPEFEVFSHIMGQRLKRSQPKSFEHVKYLFLMAYLIFFFSIDVFLKKTFFSYILSFSGPSSPNLAKLKARPRSAVVCF